MRRDTCCQGIDVNDVRGQAVRVGCDLCQHRLFTLKGRRNGLCSELRLPSPPNPGQGCQRISHYFIYPNACRHSIADLRAALDQGS
jgi:hypothetical protein